MQLAAPTSLLHARALRLASGLVLFTYILTHLLNHATGLIGLGVAERALALAKTVWFSPPGTVLLYGAAAVHITLALRTIYVRQHWRLPLIEYVRLAAGFGMPLLLIGHVVTTRIAYSAYDAEPNYTSIVSGLIASGNEGWQLALLAPGWLHGSLGLWISVARLKPGRFATGSFFLTVAMIPCLAAAGFLSMRSDIMLARETLTATTTTLDAAAAASLVFWRRAALGIYLALIAAMVLAGPMRRAARAAIGTRTGA